MLNISCFLLKDPAELDSLLYISIYISIYFPDIFPYIYRYIDRYISIYFLDIFPDIFPYIFSDFWRFQKQILKKSILLTLSRLSDFLSIVVSVVFVSTLTDVCLRTSPNPHYTPNTVRPVALAFRSWHDQVVISRQLSFSPHTGRNSSHLMRQLQSLSLIFGLEFSACAKLRFGRRGDTADCVFLLVLGTVQILLRTFWPNNVPVNVSS